FTARTSVSIRRPQNANAFDNAATTGSRLKENIEIDYLGTCCDDICSTAFRSQIFCDSEGGTHRDLCSFYKAQCRLEKRSNGEEKLKIVSIGACARRANTLEQLLRSIFVNHL
ncbi:unnamed protein product, partial [Mesorhabditis spiculigera]